MSKKSVFLMGFIGIVFFLFFLFAEKLGMCKLIIPCSNLFDPTAETFLIFIPIFLLSLLTLKMRPEIFRAWRNFAYVWVPLTILLVLWVPEYSPGFLPIEKGSVSFLMSTIFLIISLIIIIIRYLILPKEVEKER